MYYKRNPVHFLWLVPYLLVFSLGLIYSLSKIDTGFSESRSDPLASVIIFSVLIIAFSLLYFSFKIELTENGINVYEQFFRKYVFSYSQIAAVHIYRAPLGKMFGFHNIVIELKDPKEWDQVTVRLGGLISPYRYVGRMAGFPGKWGGMISIPLMSLKESSFFVKKIKSKINVEVVDNGYFHPFINKPLTVFAYIYVFGFLLLLCFALLFWVYLNIRLKYFPN